ncbi:UNVERIFIED_CONTAM: hypothetical protein GTU68_062483 [Idotea baltica]|nr:hypothetical protein [Idotea baltica]
MTSIRINSVYTKSGDKGETGLVGGQRVSKSDLRVESFGEVDELNSQLAVLKDGLTKSLEEELFDLGAELACLPSDDEIEISRTSEVQLERLEGWCDHFNKDLSELRSFIIPGGSTTSAQLHVCRTVCRRAERRVVALAQTTQSENVEIIRYLNRLSDLLFILTRWCLKVEDIDPGLWVAPNDRIVPKLK